MPRSYSFAPLLGRVTLTVVTNFSKPTLVRAFIATLARVFVDKDVRVPSHRSRRILVPRRPVLPRGPEHPDFVRDRALSQPCDSQTQVEDVWERQRGEKLGGGVVDQTHTHVRRVALENVPRKTTIPRARFDSRSRPSSSNPSPHLNLALVRSARVHSVGSNTC